MAMTITARDRDAYGDDLIDMAQRAAHEALAPELNALRAQNYRLQQIAARSQNDAIQNALDRALPGWRDVYNDARFSAWLSSHDPYNGVPRTQLLRQAVNAGDANRVVRFYQGFLNEIGRYAPAGQQRASQPRQSAASGSRVYTRPQIADLYKQRREGRIDDARWARIEADIVAAGAQGRVAGALNLRDGTAMSRIV
jgi:hypothetical protein